MEYEQKDEQNKNKKENKKQKKIINKKYVKNA